MLLPARLSRLLSDLSAFSWSQRISPSLSTFEATHAPQRHGGGVLGRLLFGLCRDLGQNRCGEKIWICFRLA